MSKSRTWCFTINNYTDEDQQRVVDLQNISTYLVCGKEVGAEGTQHLQGYVYFENQRVMTALKKLLPRAHLEIAKGNHEQNKVYCTKDNEVLIEHGQCPKQGKRSDIDQVRDRIKDGENLRTIVDTAKSYQSIRMAEIILKYNEPERDWKPEVRWYYGATGTGKSRSAREWLENDIYLAMDDAKWFEGYDAHENVLIDDFRKDFCKYHILLKMLDRYGYRVQTKGGSRQLLAKKIAITAPYRPEQMYDTREDINQLLRRIDQIILIGDEVDKSYRLINDELEHKST